MANQWGRKETIIWPPHAPIMSYTALAAAFLCICLFVWQRLHFSLPPLQQSYISEYIRSEIGSAIHTHGTYSLVHLGARKAKPRLAFPVDFVPGKMTLPDGNVVPFELSELAQAQGYSFPFRGPAEKLADASVYRWLRGAIFAGKGILVEQDFGNPLLAANYAPGDQIHYKTGSPAEHGIADNSSAIILSVDSRANTLTVATRDGHEASYNPALLKKLTGQSTVYREEQRDIAVGEHILFTESGRSIHMRFGHLATVEQIGEDGMLAVRLDSGKAVELSPNQAQDIDYGYAVDTVPRTGMDRILITGDAAQLAQQQEAFARLSSHLRDLAIYTSDSRELGLEKAAPGAEIAPSLNELSWSLDNPRGHNMELPGLGIRS